MKLNETLNNITATLNAAGETKHIYLVWDIEREIRKALEQHAPKYTVSTCVDHSLIRVHLSNRTESSYMFTVKMKLAKGTAKYYRYSSTTQYYTIKELTVENEGTGDLDTEFVVNTAIDEIKKRTMSRNDYIANLYSKIMELGLSLSDAKSLADSIRANHWELEKYENNLKASLQNN